VGREAVLTGPVSSPDAVRRRARDCATARDHRGGWGDRGPRMTQACRYLVHGCQIDAHNPAGPRSRSGVWSGAGHRPCASPPRGSRERPFLSNEQWNKRGDRLRTAGPAPVVEGWWAGVASQTGSDLLTLADHLVSRSGSLRLDGVRCEVGLLRGSAVLTNVIRHRKANKSKDCGWATPLCLPFSPQQRDSTTSRPEAHAPVRPSLIWPISQHLTPFGRAPISGILLSGFVRLPPLVAVLHLADDVLHPDPDRLGRRKRRGLVAHRRRRWRRQQVLDGRGDGSGTEEQPRAQGPQDEAGSKGSQQSPRRDTLKGTQHRPEFGVPRGGPGAYGRFLGHSGCPV
jgi:hypothetical protein